MSTMTTESLVRLARRNIFRNTRRTVLTIALIAAGLTALLFTDAYIRGTFDSMIKISTETFFGQAQIHQRGFREANDIDLYISDTEKLYAQLNDSKEIRHWSPRVLSGGMLSSSQNVSAGIIYGVDAAKEASMSKLQQAMRQGSYLSGVDGEILLGEDLADLLEVGLGDRVVVTVSQAHGGDLSQELFRVSGLFRFNDRQMDKGMAFINLSQAQKLLAVDGVHEVALSFQEIHQADDKTLPLWQALNTDDWETLNWRDLIPQLSGVLDMSDYSSWIAAVILYILVSLGLINSMFMSIYERHYEFGVLLAIGTRPSLLFWQILIEGGVIGLLSLIMGFVLGTLLTLLVAIKGINYEGAEMAGLTLNEPIYPMIDWLSFTELSLSIFLITLLACIYPAVHASRLTPSLAMRKAL